MREGVTGEVSDCSYVTYDRLEPSESRTSSSKIRGPARLLAHGKAYMPKDKCLGKIKGQRKKRDKSCVMDNRYTDPELVDPELPSSWKARQIAFQLSRSDDLNCPLQGGSGTREVLASGDTCAHERTSRQDFGGTGGLSIALQSLTDSTHWPRFACGISEGQPESQAVQAALTAAASGLASMDISSEDWHLGTSATPSDSSYSTHFSLEATSGHLRGFVAGQDIDALKLDRKSEDAEAQEDDSDWDMVSQPGSEWDIVSELDLEIC